MAESRLQQLKHMATRAGWGAEEAFSRVKDKLDPHAQEATRQFEDFLASRERRGGTKWSRIRTLNKPGQAFDWATNPQAPDSIIVRTSSGGVEDLFYVSPASDEQHNVPLVFIAHLHKDPLEARRPGTLEGVLGEEVIEHEKRFLFSVSGEHGNQRYSKIEIFKKGSATGQRSVHGLRLRFAEQPV